MFTQSRRPHRGNAAVTLAALALVVATAALIFAVMPSGHHHSGVHAPAGTASTSGRGPVLFDSDFGRKGLSAYPVAIHRERMSIVQDPVLGATRKVLKMTVYNSDTGPTQDPRAQLETPKFLHERDTFYVGFSAMFGTDWNWKMCPGCWVTFHQIYGPPYNGQGPTNLNVKSNKDSGRPNITWERTQTFGFDHPFETPLVPMKWYDFVWHEKLSRDPKRGYVELWMNGGDGWRRVPLNGHPSLSMATMIDANGSATQGNASIIALYRRAGMTPVASVYFAEHRVGTSFDSVKPHSYR
jgi:hypothetical protein